MGLALFYNRVSNGVTGILFFRRIGIGGKKQDSEEKKGEEFCFHLTTIMGGGLPKQSDL